MDEVVDAVLHNNDPVALVESVDVPLQLLVTVTTGAASGWFTVKTPFW